MKDSTVVNLEYSYEGMKVGNKTEAEYVRDRTEKRDKESGDKWLSRWQNNRATRFQPKFEQLLNKQLATRNVDLRFGNHPEAKYTLLLKTSLASFLISICSTPASRSNARRAGSFSKCRPWRVRFGSRHTAQRDEETPQSDAKSSPRFTVALRLVFRILSARR